MPWAGLGHHCREIDMIDLSFRVKVDLSKITKLMLAILILLSR